MKNQEKIKVDIIEMLPLKQIKKKVKIYKLFNAFIKEKKYPFNIAMVFGNHPQKELKGKPCYFFCFSNEETKRNEILFYTQIYPKFAVEINDFMYFLSKLK